MKTQKLINISIEELLNRDELTLSGLEPNTEQGCCAQGSCEVYA